MKKTLFSTLIVLITFAIFAQSEKSDFKKYPFKSVIIEYQIEGKTTGNKTIYIEDYGYKEATYSQTVTKMMGMKTEENTATIMVGPTAYTIDYNSGDASTATSPIAAYLAEEGANPAPLQVLLSHESLDPATRYIHAPDR